MSNLVIHVFYPVGGKTKRSKAKRQAIYNIINNSLHSNARE